MLEKGRPHFGDRVFRKVSGQIDPRDFRTNCPGDGAYLNMAVIPRLILLCQTGSHSRRRDDVPILDSAIGI